MHRDLVRYLDGELSRESLPSELAAEAAEWDELLAAARELRSVEAPPWLEDRIMRSLPATGRGNRLVRLLLEPRTVRIRPISILLGAAAAVLAFLLIPGPRTVDSPALVPVAASGGDVGGAEPGVVVQFVFVRPGARSVALAGDFNGWDPERHVLRDPDGDGVWTGAFDLPAGLHKYMFVVDGVEWVTDPQAERYVDDGYGMRNALITVAPIRARSS
jgi:hypothetical protein